MDFYEVSHDLSSKNREIIQKDPSLRLCQSCCGVGVIGSKQITDYQECHHCKGYGVVDWISYTTGQPVHRRVNPESSKIAAQLAIENHALKLRRLCQMMGYMIDIKITEPDLDAIMYRPAPLIYKGGSMKVAEKQDYPTKKIILQVGDPNV